MTRRTPQQIQQEVCEVADKVLLKIYRQAQGDPHLAIAALALAMCAIARVDGMPVAELEKILAISHRGINRFDKDETRH